MIPLKVKKEAKLIFGKRHQTNAGEFVGRHKYYQKRAMRETSGVLEMFSILI